MTEPCACATTRQVARAITQLYDAHLRPTGIEAPQFALLTALESPHSAVDLAGALALDKTTLSRNLKLLEKNAWVESKLGQDKRKRIYTLTQAGRTQLAAAKPHWKKAQSRLRANLTEREWQSLFKTLQAVTQAAQT